MADADAASGDVVRPARPSVAELREVCQPPAVRGRRNAEHWTADLYLRRYSPYLTRLLLRTPISANGVTWIMILTGWAAAAALLVPGVWGAVLAALLAQGQMLWDCCDGEVARWRRTFSPAGVFLDKLGHYTTESLVPLALGVRASLDPGVGLQWVSGWTLAGALLALLVMLNKALNDIVHVARAFAGLDRLPDTAAATTPRSGWLARLRSAARFVPFHRAYHSVELTLLALAAALVDLVVGAPRATEVLVAVLLPAALLTVVGHVVAILASNRLRAA